MVELHAAVVQVHTVDQLTVSSPLILHMHHVLKAF